eukprot:2905953-Pyramimonas_sp.AAC.1
MHSTATAANMRRGKLRCDGSWFPRLPRREQAQSISRALGRLGAELGTFLARGQARIKGERAPPLARHARAQ